MTTIYRRWEDTFQEGPYKGLTLDHVSAHLDPWYILELFDTGIFIDSPDIINREFRRRLILKDIREKEARGIFYPDTMVKVMDADAYFPERY